MAVDSPTISGRQGCCREARSGGSRKQICGLRNTKHVRGYPSRASWQGATKPKAIQGLGSKQAERAEKVKVLTWGDLLPGYQSKSESEARLRHQGSAEAIVLEVFFSGRAEHREAEGVSTTSSSRDEHRRLPTSERGTTVQTKRVKPEGVVQRAEHPRHETKENPAQEYLRHSR